MLELHLPQVPQQSGGPHEPPKPRCVIVFALDDGQDLDGCESHESHERDSRGNFRVVVVDL